MVKINKICLYIYIIFFILFLIYSIIFTGNTNHSSFDIFNDFIFCFIIGIILSIILRLFLKNKKDKIINNYHFIVLGTFLCIIILCDIFNIMIYYEKWLDRGMPSKYEFKINIK